MNPLKRGIATSEFWVTLGTIAANVIALAVLLGYVDPAKQTALTDKIVAIITLLGVIAGNVGAGVKFVHSRQVLKAQTIAHPESIAKIDAWQARTPH